MHSEIKQHKKRKRRPLESTVRSANTQIKVEGNSLQQLFNNSLRGMGHLLSPGSCSSATHYDCVMKVQVSAENVTKLLVAFLNKTLVLTHRHHAIFCTMYAEEITDKKVVAQIYGTWFKNFDAEIKSMADFKCNVNRKGDFSYVGSMVFEL